MALWKVQLGKHGKQETAALEHNVVTIGWDDLGDLSKIRSREELENVYGGIYSEKRPNSVANQVGQIWAFLSRIQVNDWVACPLKTRSAVAIGVVQSGYEYRKDLGDRVHHTRRVKWLKTDLPRTAFDQDLLYSFGAFMTVCKIERNDAESRVRAIVEGKALPQPVPESGSVSEATAIELQDVEIFAKDQIQRFIAQKFRGHKLAELVEAVLKAQGDVTLRMAPGPDGGVDILAGSGPLGFGSPRLCVQVKSSDSPVDVGVLRELRGTMEANHAEHGLLVSWGGFKSSVLREGVPAFFKIRLWDQGDLLRQLLDNYDRLPETLKADLPLKRVWALTVEEEAE